MSQFFLLNIFINLNKMYRKELNKIIINSWHRFRNNKDGTNLFINLIYVPSNSRARNKYTYISLKVWNLLHAGSKNEVFVRSGQDELHFYYLLTSALIIFEFMLFYVYIHLSQRQYIKPYIANAGRHCTLYTHKLYNFYLKLGISHLWCIVMSWCCV